MIRELVSEQKYLEAGDLFEKAGTSAERADFFIKHFDRGVSELPPTYSKIARVPAVHWATTNFDPFLRYATQQHDAQTEVLGNTTDDLLNALRLWSTGRKLCIYLHGRATHLNSIVYSTETFRQLRESEPYRELLKRIFLQHTVVMYGYSCSDPDITDILSYIGKELGGATQSSHYILTPRPIAQTELFAKANVKAIEYSPDDGHREAKEFLSALAGTEVPQRPPVVSEIDEELKRKLVRLFLSLRDLSERATTYQTACASLVLHLVGKNIEIDRRELIDSVQRSAAVDAETADQMTAEGLALLAVRKLVSVNGSRIRCESVPSAASPTADVVEAIERRIRTRFAGFDSTVKSRAAIQRTVTYVMLAQGMTVARAMTRMEDVAGYDLERLIDEALRREDDLPTFQRKVYRTAVAEILRDPNPKTAECLFQLAGAANALENLFLNPTESDVGQILNWKIYLDSNIILRLISPVTQYHREFKNVIKRCQQIGIPLAILHPFLDECVKNMTKVRELVGQLTSSGKTALRDYIESQPPSDREPLLEWYYVEHNLSPKLRFDDFIAKHKLSTSAQWAERLRSNYGIVAEEKDINRTMDTSTRETLWADLRQWRQDQSHAGRALRRNEASQVEWMIHLRDRGVRAWFLSRDSQLRRALVALQKGKYAGLVMTPTTLAHTLNQLHWGEVGLGGFSALMWSFPSLPPHERAAGMLIRRVAEAADGDELEPEWLRDQVEDVLAAAKFDAVVPASVSEASALEDEELFLSALKDILPRGVEHILDMLLDRKKAKPTK